MPVDAEWAFRRYEEVRHRLPTARFPVRSEQVPDLSAIADRFDAFVLDAFGVLNIGEAAVPGACERMAGLRAAGKRLLVLSNSATYPKSGTVEKLHRLGFDFTDDEVISSRDALQAALAREDPGITWGVAAAAASRAEELAPRVLVLGDAPEPYRRADGFVLLSSAEWTRDRQEMLCQALAERPRRLLVGNPDLVAPREGGLTPEPGLFAHEAADRVGARPEFHGKPFPGIFDLAKRRLGLGDRPLRVAMAGDTLHTDVLGGRAAGWAAVLVKDHGLMRSLDVKAAAGATGIRPDIVATTV